MTPHHYNNRPTTPTCQVPRLVSALACFAQTLNKQPKVTLSESFIRYFKQYSVPIVPEEVLNIGYR